MKNHKLEIFDIRSFNGKIYYMGTFKLDDSESSESIVVYNKQLSKDEIYEAKFILAQGDIRRRADGFIKIPKVMKNAVGTIVSNIAYALIFIDEKFPNEKEIFIEIEDKIKLRSMTNIFI